MTITQVSYESKGQKVTRIESTNVESLRERINTRAEIKLGPGVEKGKVYEVFRVLVSTKNMFILRFWTSFSLH